MDINLNKIIIDKFKPITKDILKHNYSHYWFRGGRGSTKSSYIGIITIILILTNPEVNVLVLRQVGATLKDSVYNQLLWAIDLMRLDEYFKTTLSPLEITYKPTGQKIFFRGSDDPIKIKSIKPVQGYIGVTWFEEFQQFRGMEEVRSILQSCNRGGDKYWNFYSFNPPKSRDNWVNVEVEEEQESKKVITSTYLDVPLEWLGAQFFNDADYLKRKDLTAYEHEYLGIPTGTGGAVFENLEVREITDKEIKTMNTFYYGIDFGFSVDPFAWVKLSYNPNTNILYILDEIYQRKLKNSTAVELIKEKIKTSMPYMVADSAEPKSIADFNERGLRVLPAVKGVDSVEHGLKWLQSLEKIVIDKNRTPHTWKELNLYEYDQDKHGNYLSRYPDKNNHSIDAIRYAVEGLSNRRTIKWG